MHQPQCYFVFGANLNVIMLVSMDNIPCLLNVRMFVSVSMLTYYL